VTQTPRGCMNHDGVVAAHTRQVAYPSTKGNRDRNREGRTIANNANWTSRDWTLFFVLNAFLFFTRLTRTRPYLSSTHPSFLQVAAVAPRASLSTPAVVKAARKSVAAVVAAAPVAAFAPAAFAAQEMEQLALADINILGVIATALFIIIPTSFLIVLYVKSSSEKNVSGGFSQQYYDKSAKRGDKKTNEAAILKGKGLGMRPDDTLGAKR
jgi:photosystem II PsbM protein